MSKYKQALHKQVRESVAKNLANHTIQQLHKDGEPGRLWRCANNGSSVYAFTVCAPPGWLIVYGDMGECLWKRHRDMLAFIRGSIESLDYFSEKASRDCKILDDRHELIAEWFESVEDDWREAGREWGAEQAESLESIREGYESGEGPEAFRTALYESDLYNDCEDMPDISYYTYHYLWKIEALKWFIAKIDAGEFEREDFKW